VSQPVPVAIVTGASRGAGRGIAIALGSHGCTVYVTGRSERSGDASLPGTIHETAAAVTAAGGRGVAVRVDHADDAQVEALFKQVEATPGYKLVVDLQAQAVIRPDGHGIPFSIDAFRKECLLNGWDDIGLTLRHAEKIKEFEEKRRIDQPWLFA